MTADLITRLRAALDAEEAIAQAAAGVRGAEWWHDGGQVLAGQTLDGGSAAIRSLAMAARSHAEGEHAARHDPAFVLADIAAKRVFIAEYERFVAERRRMMGGWDTGEASPVLRAFAEAYGITEDDA